MEFSKLRASLRGNAHRRARVLVLYNSWFLYGKSLEDHVESFALYSNNSVLCADVAILDENIDLRQFDVIVMHYSLVVIKAYHDLSEHRRNKIINSNALKVLFVQDEIRWVNHLTDAIAELNINVLFSVHRKAVTDVIYKTHPVWNVPILPNLRIERTLTGFVDERLLDFKVPSYTDRKLDVVYRARMLPYWIGRSGMEKGLMAERFNRSVVGKKLKMDISTAENERIYGDAWLKFMSSSKATLGTEGAAGLTDYDNTLFAAVDAYVKEHPEASFEEVEAAVFPGLDGKVVYKALSPRCFEAAALRTLMIQYDGEYSGALEAHKHYVLLERDHSNINDVIKILRDPKEAGRYIDAAYDDVAASGKYSSRAFLAHFDAVVAEELAATEAERAKAWDQYPYRGFLVDINPSAAPVLVSEPQIEPIATPIGHSAVSVAQIDSDKFRALVAKLEKAVERLSPIEEVAVSQSVDSQVRDTGVDVGNDAEALPVALHVVGEPIVETGAIAVMQNNEQVERERIKLAKEARNLRIKRSFALFFLPKKYWDWVPK